MNGRTPRVLLSLTLMACAPPAQPRLAPDARVAAPALAVPLASAEPDGEKIRVCVVTPQGEMQDVAATYRPETGDTLVDGRPFGEAHPADEPQYASAHRWFSEGAPIAAMTYEYVPFGVRRSLESAALRRVASHRGVPVFADTAVQTPPRLVHLPVRPGCELQAYQLRGGLRYRWPAPWPNPSASPDTALRLVSIVAGPFYSCALSTGSDVYCWGQIVPDDSRPAAEVINDGEIRPAAAGGLRVSSIAAGGAHACALTPDGRAYCSGRNDHGQLGDGTRQSRFRPAPVAGRLRFASIAAGAAFTCALTHEGRAYCWGWNGAGQLGDGTTISRPHPTAVAGRLRFTRIAANAAFTCALADSGEAYCWGRPGSRDFGHGDSLMPVPMAGEYRFDTISVGERHACALSGAGEAYCWGSNDDGQLGTGTVGDARKAPAAVGDGHLFSAIAAGVRHSCGLTRRGVATCWGSNDRGQLGDGSLEDRSAPTVVAGDHRFARIVVGTEHSCGLTNEGTVYCWGRNDSGQLGGVSGHYRDLPTRIQPW